MTVDLNKWSAEVVMGWKHFTHGIYYGPDGRHQDWTPLTDKNQLFMVVEKMRELGYQVCIENSVDYNLYHIVFYIPEAGILSDDVTLQGDGDDLDLPTAVLRAARQALSND